MIFCLPASLRSLTLAVGCALALAACKKDDDTPPVTPAPVGAITGLVTPADGVRSITAADGASHTYTTTPGPTGTFNFARVTPGTYTVRFQTTPGYITPAPRTALVANGDTTHLGLTELYPGTGAAGGTAELVLDTYPVQVQRAQGALVAGFLTLEFFLASSSVVLQLDAPAPNATFALTGPSVGRYGQQGAPCSWSSTNGGTGSATLTRYDTVARLASGTFAFTAPTAPGSPGGCNTITISRGTFTDVPF